MLRLRMYQFLANEVPPEVTERACSSDGKFLVGLCFVAVIAAMVGYFLGRFDG